MTLQRPTKPPSYQQERIAKLIAYGYDCKQVGLKLGLNHRTVRHYVEQLASKLPEDESAAHPEVFTPYMRVQVWAYWEYRIKPTLESAA